MHAVVVGGSGQIGGWLLRTLGRAGPRGGRDVSPRRRSTASSRSTPPTSTARRDWLRAQRPDVVFYPAGFTWVDGCERDPARARAANLDQPLNLARAAAEVGARFVYFSTDYVFDGGRRPYAEADPPNPLSVYGRAKLDAELALAELRDRPLTVRTSWVFGPERQGKNFAYQLARTLGRGQGRWSAPRTRFRARATAPTSPERSSRWSSRAGRG